MSPLDLCEIQWNCSRVLSVNTPTLSTHRFTIKSLCQHTHTHPCPSLVFRSCPAMLPLLSNRCVMHCKQRSGYAVYTRVPRDRDRETEPWTGSLSLTLHTINQLHDALLTRKVLIKHDDLRFAMASPPFFPPEPPGL